MTSNPFQLLRKTIPSLTTPEAAEATSQGPVSNPNEILIVYPSYSRQTDTGVFEVDVRGWLFLEGSNNRKSRILNATARKIAGISQTPSNVKPSKQSLPDGDSDFEEEDMNTDYFDDELTATNTARSVATDYSLNDKSSEILRNRLSGFLTKSLNNRQIKITFSGLTDRSGMNMKEFYTETNSSGRFSLRLTLYKRPTVVSVEANDQVVSFEPVINVDRYGVSVISDIDDTVKVTGVLGNKRELFRNVFVHEYEKIAIEGVKEWYQELSNLGVQFHYVSNSPWQLYPTIQSYLNKANLPHGSMHLKDYTGFLLNGLFESAGERKKKNLYKILNDFPDRKFLLIGDSGEGDLEAYIDVACHFPCQVLAICIRDVTMPESGEKDWEVSQFRRNMIPRPDEIDMYENILLKSTKTKSRISIPQGQSIKNSPSSLGISDQTKPLSVAHSITPNPECILNGSDSTSLSKVKSKDLNFSDSVNHLSNVKSKSNTKKLVVRRKPVGDSFFNDESDSVSNSNTSVTAPISSSEISHCVLSSSSGALQRTDSLSSKNNITSQDTINIIKTPIGSFSDLSTNQKLVHDTSNSIENSRLLRQNTVPRKPVIRRSLPEFLNSSSYSNDLDDSMNGQPLSSKNKLRAKHSTFDQSISQNFRPVSRIHTSPSMMLRAPSEEFELAELRDKRAENWKLRVMRARLLLPPEIKLYMWKTGNDVRSECVDCVRREMMKIINA